MWPVVDKIAVAAGYLWTTVTFVSARTVTNITVGCAITFFSARAVWSGSVRCAIRYQRFIVALRQVACLRRRPCLIYSGVVALNRTIVIAVCFGPSEWGTTTFGAGTWKIRLGWIYESSALILPKQWRCHVTIAVVRFALWRAGWFSRYIGVQIFAYMFFKRRCLPREFISFSKEPPSSSRRRHRVTLARPPCPFLLPRLASEAILATWPSRHRAPLVNLSKIRGYSARLAD